jgi:hypothetical protein
MRARERSQVRWAYSSTHEIFTHNLHNSLQRKSLAGLRFRNQPRAEEEKKKKVCNLLVKNDDSLKGEREREREKTQRVWLFSELADGSA